MSTSILVTYATRYGSTQEVAEAVAATLRELGLTAETQPMPNVQTLDGYRGVVLGAPLYIGRLHKDARRFLARHGEALKKQSVAIFALGPLHPDEEEWQAARTQLDQALAKVPWLKPVAVELFGGQYDPAKLRLPDSLLVRLPASPLHQMPACDIRDWAAIRAWANSIRPLLLQ